MIRDPIYPLQWVPIETCVYVENLPPMRRQFCELQVLGWFAWRFLQIWIRSIFGTTHSILMEFMKKQGFLENGIKCS